MDTKQAVAEEVAAVTRGRCEWDQSRGVRELDYIMVWTCKLIDLLVSAGLLYFICESLVLVLCAKYHLSLTEFLTKPTKKTLATWINLIFFILKSLFLFIVETEQKEIQVLTKLKETVDKQREELRKYKTEVKHKAADCDAVSVA